MKRNTSNPKTLPTFLSRYFWEVDFAQIRLPRHRTYVIERILERGDDRAIRWLKKSFRPQTIAKVVRQSRVISPNTANLWALALDIPRDEITCFSTHFLLPHGPFSRG